LEAVRQSTRAGKRRLEAMDPSLTRDMAEAMGPHITSAIFTMMYHASKLGPLGHFMPGGPNFVLSNLPGPADPVYLSGAELKWGTGLGPIMPNMGLFITVTSCLGRFTYGVSACRDMLADPQFFQRCLYRSFEETQAAWQQQAGAGHPDGH